MSVAQLDVMLDRPLPQAPDAERAVLGSVLINNACWYRISLTDRDFFRDAHRTIFRVMAHILINLREECDLLTIRVELQKQGKLEEVGGTAYVASLIDSIPDIANVERYADIVAEKARLRALVVEGNRIMRAALDHDADADAIVADAMAALGPQATKQDNQAVPLVTALGEAFTAQQALVESGKSSALTSGWKVLDEHRVFSPTLVIDVCPSGDGKTAHMIALSKALGEHGHRSAVFSRESSIRQIALRYASSDTGIPHTEMRDWHAWPATFPRNYEMVAECRSRAAKQGIFLSRGSAVVEEMVLEMRRLRAMEGIECAFIDYIQKLTTRRKIHDREERMAEIAALLLDTAVDLDITVFATSQMEEKKWRDRGMGPIYKEDISYAAMIGKSARTILTFHRPRKLYKDEKMHQPDCYVHMQIVKNNEERTHDGFEAHFDEWTQRFEEGAGDGRCRTSKHSASEPTERTLFNT